MDNKTLLTIVGIIVYYFIQFSIINAFVSSSLYDYATINTTTTAINTTSFNATGDDTTISDKTSLSGGSWDALSVMFLFSAGIPHISGFPSGVLAVISFHNWILAAVIVICSYRIINPLS